MNINLIFKIAAVGILVSILSQVLKHSGRDEQAFLTSLAGLIVGASIYLRSVSVDPAVVHVVRGEKMSMLQVGVIGVLGVLFAVQFKSGKSEYAVYISVAVSLLLFGCMLERLRDAVDSLGRIGNYIKVDQRFFGTMMKMIGITYLAEFSSGICKDAGYQSIASQIEIFSKLTILAMGLPILQTLLEVMTGFLG